MDKPHTCKICNKRFKGGKAMGGHMRSHLAKFPLPPKQPSPPPPPPQHSSPEFTSLSTTSSTTLNNSNNNNVFRIRNINSTVMQKMMPSVQRRQVSSFASDVFSPEDCAVSLMMLSRDQWNFKKQVVIDEVDDDENDESFDDVEEEEEEGEEEEEEEEDDVIFRQRTTPTTTSRTANGKYKCETCKKVFKSYQALGGHRASHKRIRQHQVLDDEEEDVNGGDDFEEEEEEEVVPVVNNVAATGGGSGEGYNRNLPVVVEHPPPRTFECPFCFKLFDSGQALGGHKKVHYYNNNNSAASTGYYNANNHSFPAANSANINAHANRASSSSANFGDNNNLVIDLNLPALEDSF